MVTETAFRRKVLDAAASINMKSQRKSLSTSVKVLVDKTLTAWGAVRSPEGVGAFALESMAEVVPARVKGFNALADADATILMKGMLDLGMSNRHIEDITESSLRLFDNVNYKPADIMRDGFTTQGSYVDLSKVVGRTAASEIGGYDTSVGLEAFGDDINSLNTDDRLTMDLMIMRPWDNIMDKALARVSESSPVVTIRVPSPEAWDWAKTQAAGSTSATRNGSSNTYRLRDLYRNPSPVNSAAKKIVPVFANDSTGVLAFGGTTYYKAAKNVELLDLSRNSAVFSYDHIDRTDLVSDGGVLDGVVIDIVNPNGGSPITEHFLLPTRAFQLAMFVKSPNNKASGQRQVMMECTLPINASTKQYDGTTASTIAAALTDAKIQANIRISATLNLQTGSLQASGTATLELKPLASGVAISAPTNTLFGNLTATVSAYSVDLYFDEENQRKANLSVWVQYYEQQFVVPRSRIYFTEYSLTQDVDDNAIEATSSIVALGNGRRGLDIVVNSLNDIAQGLTFAAANPEISTLNGIDEQSFAASLVKPTVVSTSMDFASEELNVMNESTRLTEIHGRFRARFLSLAAQLFAKSLMLNQFKGGETPVLKAWVHSTIADLVIGILDYHPDLKDRQATATGADYSMALPNGYRLDIIKSNLDCLQQRIYAVPVIESDMASIISAASIRDCGTVTTNYTPTNSGSVVRRVATCTREIVMMSNKVGIMMSLTGLQTQLGVASYAAVPLSADFSESLAV